MSYLITSNDGDIVAQHHDQVAAGGTGARNAQGSKWPPDKRMTARKIRVKGYDDYGNLLLCAGPNSPMPDEPSSLGDGYASEVVWYASNQADPASVVREVAYWTGACAGVAQPPVQPPPSPAPGTTGSRALFGVGPGAGIVDPSKLAASGEPPPPNPPSPQGDPYKSNVKSGISALPAFWQDPATLLWAPDTGVLPQKVSLMGGQEVAGGTPLILLPMTVRTEQQLAAAAVGNQLVAVWFGGQANGRLGTLVYDVDTKGNLDRQRRARVHSSWRIYRLPALGTKQLLPMGGVEGGLPVSSGIAWQLGLDIDKQAGYGAVVDMVAPKAKAPPPGPPKTPTGGTPQAPPPGPTVIPGTTTSVSTPGGGSPAFSSKPSDGSFTIGSTASKDPTPPDPPTPTASTLPPVPVIGLTGRSAYGTLDVGDVDDIHHIADTPDKEPINCTHFFIRNPIKGDGFDAPMKTAGAWLPPTPGGPLIIEVFFRTDLGDTHPFIDGARPGLRKWQAHVPWDIKAKNVRKVPTEETKDTSDAETKDNSKDVSGEAKDGSKDGAKEVTLTGKGESADDKDGVQDVFFHKGDQPDKSIYWNADDKAAYDASVQKAVNDNAPGHANIKVIDDPINGGGAGDVGTSKALSLTFGGSILFAPGPDAVADDQSDTTIRFNRGYASSPLEARFPAWLAYPVPVTEVDLRGRTSTLTPEQAAAYKRDVPVSGVIAGISDQSSGTFVFNQNALPGTSLYPDGAAQGGFVFTPGNVDASDVQAGRTLPGSMPTTSFFFATTATQLAFADPGPSGLPINGFATHRDSATVLTTDYVGADGSKDATAAMQLVRSSANTGTLSVFGVTLGAGAAADCSLYGDGSDGVATCDGAAAVAGMTLAALTYTLTRDVFFNTLTLNNAITIATANFVIHCRTSLTNNGIVSSNGLAGAAGGAGTGAGGAATAVGTLIAGTAGGNGQVGNGVAGSNTQQSYGGAGGAGGNGGGGRTGGAAGTATAPAATAGSVRSRPSCVLGVLFGGAGITQATAGASGGGGAGDGAAGKGGGGGAGATGLYVVARLITGNGAFNSIGGNGGAGTNPNCSGGGAGGGGAQVFTCPDMTGYTGTYSQASGNIGLGGGGTGTNGALGAAGSKIQVSAAC